MKEAIRNIVMPVFIGIILFGIEILISLKLHSIKIVFVYSVIYMVAAYCIAKLCRKYDACAWLQIGSCGSYMLGIAFISLLLSKTPLAFIGMYISLLNWLAITSVCIILKFITHEDSYSGFKRFFRVSSIIFGLLYVMILLYALFFKAIGTNGVNLVPFSTIMSYTSRIAHTNSGGAMMNIVANILLFIPSGFYTGVLLRKRKMKIKIMIIILIPIIVELIQFVFSLGICDVDDVILNTIGGLLGILVLKALERFYSIVKKEDTTRLFLI